MDDQDLIAAFLKGDEGAFEGLMVRYERRVFYLVKAMVRDAEEARDITQDTFIKAFRGLRRLRKRDRFRPWLFRIAVNGAWDHLRARRDNESLDSSVESDLPSQETRSIQEDLKEKIRAEMDHLPPRQKEVFILRLFQDMDYKEIAQVLKIDSRTARAHFHFALKRLRVELRKRGVFNGL